MLTLILLSNLHHHFGAIERTQLSFLGRNTLSRKFLFNFYSLLKIARTRQHVSGALIVVIEQIHNKRQSTLNEVEEQARRLSNVE